jgi:hypothetical protein
MVLFCTFLISRAVVFLMFIDFYFNFVLLLRQGLTIYSRLVLDSWSSCLSLPECHVDWVRSFCDESNESLVHWVCGVCVCVHVCTRVSVCPCVLKGVFVSPRYKSFGSKCKNFPCFVFWFSLSLKYLWRHRSSYAVMQSELWDLSFHKVSFVLFFGSIIAYLSHLYSQSYWNWFFCDSRVWRQGLALALQALYYLSNTPVLFCFSYFSDSFLELFVQCQPWTLILLPMHPT